MNKDKLKIGIYELTGCAGCALLIADCEMELIDIFNAADIQSFLMVKSDNIDGELDIALVEGSVSTEKEIEELKDIRKRANVVVAFGLCASVGGIQARFSQEEWADNLKEVYGDVEMVHNKAVRSKPIDAYIDVDFYVPGCPVGKDQFLNFLTRVLNGSPPENYPRPVCVSCKYKENDCLLNKGIPCLGPLTADGCGAVCCSHNLPCVGCWGPAVGANPASEYYLLKEYGIDPEEIKNRMANYSGTKLVEFLQQFKEESQ